MKLLDLGAQYKNYKQEIDESIAKVIASQTFIGGEEISCLEKELQNYCGAPYAIACSSGTDALLLALMAAGIKAGDEIITTPFTFVATAEAPFYLGASIKFIDVNPNTYLINEECIEKVITKKTKVILPVSLFGMPNNFSEINRIAKKHGIMVIEDAAQSFGAKDNNLFSCNLSPMACTSFFPAKPLGGYGDGGAVFVQNKTNANKIRALLNHGSSKKYYHDEIGINGRLDALQAAIIRVKLKHFNKERSKRIELAEIYNQKLANCGLTLPKVLPNKESVFAQYCVLAASKQERKKILAYLLNNNIPHAVYYPIPLHLQKAFTKLNYSKGNFPVAENLSERIFALPLHPFLTQSDQNKVINAVLNFYNT